MMSQMILGRLRRSCTVAFAIAASGLLSFAMVGCTDQDHGTITEKGPTSESTTSQNDQGFVVEIDPASCPSSEVIPEEFGNPEGFEYNEQFSRPQGPQTILCAYLVDGYLEDLVVVDRLTIGSIAVQFAIADDLPPWSESELDGSLDFGTYPMASYFEGWQGSSQRMEVSDHYSIPDHTVIRFELFTRLDNLYLNVGATVVIPDELALDDGDYIPEAAVATAVYGTLDQIVPSVVDGLERE